MSELHTNTVVTNFHIVSFANGLLGFFRRGEGYERKARRIPGNPDICNSSKLLEGLSQVFLLEPCSIANVYSKHHLRAIPRLCPFHIGLLNKLSGIQINEKTADFWNLKDMPGI